MPKRLKKQKTKRHPKTRPAQTEPLPVPAKSPVIRSLAALLLSALFFYLTFQPAVRMARLWVYHDAIPRYKLHFEVDGVSARWGYACWIGPFMEDQNKFGFPGEALNNEMLKNLPPVLNQNIEGGILNINGVAFPAGIGTHAPSKIAFSLEGKVSRFSCLAGLDMTAKDSLGVIYSLWADGREIFRSPKLKPGADPFPISVSVAGAKELVLSAETTEFADTVSDVDWVNPKFEP
jgi:hypothetical protein